MPMLATTLGNGLANMAPTMLESVAIDNFATAWGVYFNDAVAGVPYGGDPGDLAKEAMKTAMVGMSATGVASIQAGIVAYWGQLISAPAIAFAAATAITPPPGLTDLATSLPPVFLANIVGSLSLADASNAVAAVIHAANAGGSATFPAGPTVIA